MATLIFNSSAIDAFYMMLWIVIIASAVIGITIMCIYLLSLQNTLKEIQAKNRKMEPGQLWLLLIPIFGLVWHFIIVNKLSSKQNLQFQKATPYKESKLSR